MRHGINIQKTSPLNLKNLKEKLAANEVTLGSWIMLGHPAIAEIFAKSGLDWIVVDLEHTTTSESEAGELLRIIDLCGVFPMVRLTSNNPDQIKRMMDAGARGIVVPNVKTVEQAQQAVAATRYGPRGIRGVGLAKAQSYGPGFRDYLQWQENGPIVIVQIEDIHAVDEIEAILEVDGVDGYFVGPYDLSCSMGIPGQFEHPDFQTVLDRIVATGRRLNRPSGIHIVEPDEAKLLKAVRDGYRIIAWSVDTRLLDTGIRAGVSLLRKEQKSPS